MGMGSRGSPDENKKGHNYGTGITVETGSTAGGVVGCHFSESYLLRSQRKNNLTLI